MTDERIPLYVEAILAACPQLHPAQARIAALNVQKVNEAFEASRASLGDER